MKKILFFLLFLALLVVGFILYMNCEGDKGTRPDQAALHADSSAAAGMTFKHYENERYGYSIDYPEVLVGDSSSIAQLDIVRMEMPDKGMNNVTIEVKEKPQGWSEEERKAEYEQAMADVEAFSPGGEFKNTEWSYMYDFDDVIPLHEMTRVVYQGNRRYQVTYTYDEEGKAALAAGRVHSVQSFKVKK